MATLWLIGMMGSGKSTVGPRVADALGRWFVDLDQVITVTAGTDVPRIFADEGEEGFRRRESEALRMVAGGPSVVACGGGVILDDDNVALMREVGYVAWLDAPARVLSARVGGGSGRPLLGDNPGPKLAGMLRSRRPRYQAAAHRRFDADRKPEEIAGEVVRWWRNI